MKAYLENSARLETWARDTGTCHWKIWSRTLKNKLRRRRNVINKYQVSRKMYDVIDVRLYLCRRRNNYDCTLNIKQRNGR